MPSQLPQAGPSISVMIPSFGYNMKKRYFPSFQPQNSPCQSRLANWCFLAYLLGCYPNGSKLWIKSHHCCVLSDLKRNVLFFFLDIMVISIHFFNKQTVCKQLALGWQIAKQLSGLNALSRSNNKNYRLTVPSATKSQLVKMCYLRCKLRIFFISQKSFVPFLRYSSFCILNDPLIYQIRDVMISISTCNRMYFWIYLLNHKSLSLGQLIDIS